ncbi:hypothetical protein [Poseidonocella sp. HB161398]|uniref:hypothetical protein n=1 Tax=Poseidonocella sp. HB161398 TaxID=2320855 RepID=UPI001108F2DB|nr:hypothetical protein [Poseidonocella sp. HB161398]
MQGGILAECASGRELFEAGCTDDLRKTDVPAPANPDDDGRAVPTGHGTCDAILKGGAGPVARRASGAGAAVARAVIPLPPHLSGGLGQRDGSPRDLPSPVQAGHDDGSDRVREGDAPRHCRHEDRRGHGRPVRPHGQSPGKWTAAEHPVRIARGSFHGPKQACPAPAAKGRAPEAAACPGADPASPTGCWKSPLGHGAWAQSLEDGPDGGWDFRIQGEALAKSGRISSMTAP